MKKITLILSVLVIAYSYTYGQNTLGNSIVVISGDTFALIQINDIRLSQNKHILAKEYKEVSDSLTKEIQRQDKEINERKRLYVEQLKRDSLQNKAYYILKAKYTSLDTDYNKLTKVNRLNGVLGGEVGALYSTATKAVNNPYIALNLGLMLKRKYIITAKVGFNLNSEILIGLNGSMVF